MAVTPSTMLELSHEIRYRLAAASHANKGLSVAELLSQTVQRGEDLPLKEFARFVADVPDTVIRTGLWYLTKPPGRYAPKPPFVQAAGAAEAHPAGTVVRIDLGDTAHYGVVNGSSEFDGCLSVERWAITSASSSPSKALWDVHGSRITAVEPAEITDASVRQAVETAAKQRIH